MVVHSCDALGACSQRCVEELTHNTVACLSTGGAKLVDLRDARSAAHVEARFCAALEVEQVRLLGNLIQQ